MTNQRNTSPRKGNPLCHAIAPQLAREGFIATFIGNTVGIFRLASSATIAGWSLWVHPAFSSSGRRMREATVLYVQRDDWTEAVAITDPAGMNLWITGHSFSDNSGAWTLDPDELEANFEAFAADQVDDEMGQIISAIMYDEADDAFDRRAYAVREPLIEGEPGSEIWTAKARADRERRIGR